VKVKNSRAKYVRVILLGLMVFSSFSPGFGGRWAWADERAKHAKYAPGEALVMLKNRVGQLSASALSSAAAERYISGVAMNVGAKAVTTYASLSEAQDGIFVLIRSETKSTEELVAELKNNPDVASVSPNYRVRAAKDPNDPQYGELWGMKSIKADAAWDTTTGSDEVYVAVIDSGVYASHEDLSPNIDRTRSRNFVNPTGSSTPVNDQNYNDGDGHGTHVAGTIAAVGNNGIGVVGINWNAKIIALRVLDDDGKGYNSWIIAAIDYLVGLLRENPSLRVPAVNLSLGGWDPETPSEAQTSALWRAFQSIDATNRSVIVVAAGNESHEVGAPAPYTIARKEIIKGDYCYPASFTGLNNLIVVGAIDKDNEALSSSTGGSSWSSSGVHLAAPGTNIMSTYTFPPYSISSGTSMAAPHVAGAAALVASHRPGLTANQLKTLLCGTANGGVNPKSPGTVWGYTIPPQNVPDRTLSRYGLLDVSAALKTEVPTVPVTGITVTPSSASLSVGDTLQLRAALTPENATDVTVLWSSSEAGVAAVDETGLVKALSSGTAAITAQALGGGNVSQSALISVTTLTSTPSPSPASSQKSGGGCNGGFGIVFLASLAAVFWFFVRGRMI
jgi:subtilisin family serine protease